MSHGISAYDGKSVVIFGEAQVTAEGGVVTEQGNIGSFDEGSIGISAQKDVLITGGAVTAVGGRSDGSQGKSRGVYGVEQVSVRGTAELNAAGGEAGVESIGIDGGRLLEVSGTAPESAGVTAVGGKGASASCGVYATAVTVSGGKLDAAGGEAKGENGYSEGIRVQQGELLITGGSIVTGRGGEATKKSRGLNAFTENLVLSGDSQLTAVGGKAEKSHGIAAGENSTTKSFTISDTARIDAVGGEAALVSCGILADSNMVMTVSGSSVVTATGGKTSGGESHGIIAHILNVTGGNVTAEGETADSLSGCGIMVAGNYTDSPPAINLSGGTTAAEGKAGALSKAPTVTGLVLIGKKLPTDGFEVVSGQVSGYSYAETRPAVKSVSLAPVGATVVMGGAKQLTATTVFLDDSSLKDGGLVDWTVTGAEKSGTAISGNGLLTVALDETAAAVTVTARSKTDASFSASTVVAISAKEPTPPPSTGGGSGGGGTTYYTITAQAGKNGSISPSGEVQAAQGENQIFTITPDAGCEVYDVLVDGESVGAVESYTLEKVRAKHTVEARFVTDFTDVAEDDWHHSAVQYVAWRELFNGTGHARFSPELDMSRAMLVTVLYRAAGEPDVEDQISARPFTDVDANSWYGKAVYWARWKGLAAGTGAETFSPESPITREELALILYRYAGGSEMDGERRDEVVAPYADADSVSGWAAQAIAWAVDTGILNGKSGNMLDPQGSASRAEVAAMLQRFEAFFKAE